MRNRYAILSFLALIVIVAGCTSSSEASGPSSSSFVGGSSAIKLSFLSNSPPSEVTDDDFGFQAVVTVENVGEFTIPEGKLAVSLKGFFPADFGTVTDKLTFSHPTTFEGVQKGPDGKIKGEITQVEFPIGTDAEFKYIPTLIGDPDPFPFIAEACYQYRTNVISQFCILDDLTKIDNDVCNPSGSKSVSNSGAPVHITSVSQSIGSKDKVILTFKIRSVGRSDIFDPTVTDCRNDPRTDDRVKVTINTGLTPPPDCLGLLSGNVVRLENGVAEVTCIQTLTAGSSPDSVKSFDITLDYQVKDSIRTNVKVKHLIGGSGGGGLDLE